MIFLKTRAAPYPSMIFLKIRVRLGSERELIDLLDDVMPLLLLIHRHDHIDAHAFEQSIGRAKGIQ